MGPVTHRVGHQGCVGTQQGPQDGRPRTAAHEQDGQGAPCSLDCTLCCCVLTMRLVHACSSVGLQFACTTAKQFDVATWRMHAHPIPAGCHQLLSFLPCRLERQTASSRPRCPSTCFQGSGSRARTTGGKAAPVLGLVGGISCSVWGGTCGVRSIFSSILLFVATGVVLGRMVSNVCAVSAFFRGM